MGPFCLLGGQRKKGVWCCMGSAFLFGHYLEALCDPSLHHPRGFWGPMESVFDCAGVGAEMFEMLTFVFWLARCRRSW